MRKTGTLLLFIAVSILCSCGQGNNNTPVRNGDTTAHSKAADEKAIQAYEQYIKTLDTTKPGNATLAAQKYKALFGKTDTTTNDKGFNIFEEYYTRLMFGLNEHFESDKTLNRVPASLKVDKPATYPSALAKYADELKANGYEFIESEGTLEISEDRDFIAKWFYSSVSATMKRYLEEINKENKEGLEEDGALLISTIDLSERAIWWENFTTGNPHFSLSGEAMRQKQLYLTFLLKGLDNSPILNYDSHKLTEFYKGAYTHLLAKYPDAEVTKMIKPFYEALLANNMSKADEVISKYEDQKLLLW